MPRAKINCPKCNYNEASFMITSDLEDTKIVLIYICANPDECGHWWKNEEN